VSITVDTQDKLLLSNQLNQLKTENQGIVGVDLVISALATLSTSEVITEPKALTALLSRLRKFSRSLSRKQKNSKNRNKAKLKLAKLRARIACIRSDALHKLTNDLTKRFHTIVIEDLNVKVMVKNRRIARSISDMGFFEFHRQLNYKADIRGNSVKVADRFLLVVGLVLIVVIS